MEKKFFDAQGKEIKRTKCFVYSRVSGFITPVCNYNIGKRAEFYSRKFYSEARTLELVKNKNTVGSCC